MLKFRDLIFRKLWSWYIDLEWDSGTWRIFSKNLIFCPWLQAKSKFWRNSNSVQASFVAQIVRAASIVSPLANRRAVRHQLTVSMPSTPQRKNSSTSPYEPINNSSPRKSLGSPCLVQPAHPINKRPGIDSSLLEEFRSTMRMEMQSMIEASADEV